MSSIGQIEEMTQHRVLKLFWAWMSTRDSAPWGPKRNLSQQIGAVMPKAAGTVLEESSTQFRGRRQERLVCCTVAPDDKALKVVSGGHEDGKKIYDLVENVVKDTLPESS
jgi:hypothetical protein